MVTIREKIAAMKNLVETPVETPEKGIQRIEAVKDLLNVKPIDVNKINKKIEQRQSKKTPKKNSIPEFNALEVAGDLSLLPFGLLGQLGVMARGLGKGEGEAMTPTQAGATTLSSGLLGLPGSVISFLGQEQIGDTGIQGVGGGEMFTSTTEKITETTKIIDTTIKEILPENLGTWLLIGGVALVGLILLQGFMRR